MTKNRKSHGGLERCRNFRNLNESEPDARPVPVKVDPLQADVRATKWVAPSSLSAPPSAGPQVSRRGPGWRPVLRSATWQGQETLPQLGPRLRKLREIIPGLFLKIRIKIRIRITIHKPTRRICGSCKSRGIAT